MSIELTIAPSMIEWAIKRAGMRIDEVTFKYPHVGDWLSEKKKPTLAQLEKFSGSVHLPFGYFFLQSPPQEVFPIPFYRTHGSTIVQPGLDVLDTVKLLQGRQEWLTEHLQNEGEEPLPFVGKFGLHNRANEIAQDMRSSLRFDPNWASKLSNWTKAKLALTEGIENLGIVVCFNGVYENNNLRKLKVEEMRGFVLVDPYVPFLFVNNNDSKSAQIFTIAHELAHIWLGESAAFDTHQLLPANDPIEQLCDQIAAEFLVPSDLFREQWNESASLQSAARFFKVSELVVARRALDLGLMTKPDYFSFYNSYTKRDFEQKTTNGGGNFYALAKVRLGKRFLTQTAKALQEGNLLHRDAYKLTGLKGDTLRKVFEHTLAK
jgi:Zn-dependent peptidase ImmA (M78 family)